MKNFIHECNGKEIVDKKIQSSLEDKKCNCNNCECENCQCDCHHEN